MQTINEFSKQRKQPSRIGTVALILFVLIFSGLNIYLVVTNLDKSLGEEPIKMENVITVNCKDGICYDPETGKAIGDDKEIFMLSSPIGKK